MTTIQSIENQTIFDIAIKHYGNLEAVEEILTNNPLLMNDPEICSKNNVPFYPDQFDLAMPIRTNTYIYINETSSLMNQKIVRELANVDIISFDNTL
jgi:hypothetical protein